MEENVEEVEGIRKIFLTDGDRASYLHYGRVLAMHASSISSASSAPAPFERTSVAGAKML
jgi:hypothetical protein